MNPVGAGSIAARLRWPWPALLVWTGAWAVFAGLRAAGATPALGFAVAAAVGTLPAAGRGFAASGCRRVIVAAGFPLSWLLVGGGVSGLPAIVWLAPVALLAVLYPMRAWGDAPLFPTPAGALSGLPEAAPLAPGARLLDAGCGVGDGLIELARAYPLGRVEGVEWSRPLAFLAGRRCGRRATVRRGDLWGDDWSAFDLVYLFQRPESMQRAWDKARREMRPGAVLVSLEFPVPGIAPAARLDGAGGRPVWVYRPGAVSSRSGAATTPAADRRADSNEGLRRG